MLFVLVCLYSTKNQFKFNVKTSFQVKHTLSEVIYFFNENLEVENYNCLIDLLNNLENWENITENNLNIFNKCINDDFKVKKLRYMIDIHYYSPKIYFFNNNRDNITTQNEIKLNSIEYIDLQNKRILPKDTLIRPIIIGNHSFLQDVCGFGVELKPFNYSMEYNIKDTIKYNDITMKPYIEDEFIKMYGKEVGDNMNFDIKKAFYSFLKSVKKNDNKLGRVKELIQNWPLLTKHLSKYNDDIKDDKRNLENYINTFLMNGRKINISTFDPFTFSDILDQEYKIHNALKHGFQLTPDQVSYIGELSLKSDPVYVDVSDSPVLWFNDIEKDKKYMKQSDNIELLFGEVKQLPTIRRNLINIIIFTDFSRRDSYDILIAASELLSKGYSIRIGLVPVCSYDPLSKRIFNIFLEALKNRILAFKFLIALGRNRTSTDYISKVEYHYQKTYKNNVNYQNEVINQDYAKIANDYIESRNIIVPSVWCNGIFYTENLYDLETYAYTAFNDIRINLAESATVPRNILKNFLEKKLAVKQYIDVIHTNKPSVFDILSLPEKEILNFINSIKNINYTFNDEYSSVTAWIWVRRNINTIQQALGSYFIKRKELVRISVLQKLPSCIERIIRQNKLINKTLDLYDATIIINGQIININADFEFYHDLFSYKSSNSIKLPQSFSKIENLNLFYNILLINTKSNNLQRLYLDKNIFDSTLDSVLKIKGNPFLRLELILDPFSKDSMKILGFLHEFSRYNLSHISIRFVITNKQCVPDIIYRYSLTDNIMFSLLNSELTYSAILDIPETWIVEQHSSPIDIDNININDLPEGLINIDFNVECIVIEGEMIYTNNTYAAGINIFIDDYECGTTTMKQYGYWQFRRYPGQYKIFTSHDDYEIIHVDTFSWKYHTFVITNTNSAKELKQSSDNNTIHIFAVVSGYLYERLVKIMMLSVVKNTKSHCRFILLKNYLSPRFKSDILKMANHYSFDVCFVTYHWPFWLYHQTEKNRVMWGYKILFLDILFNINVKRIIYIDSDQVIRTDMSTLITMDIGNLSYAFTPMCNDKLEAEPYRFWNKGFWKEHLKGLPYHISALFMVDIYNFKLHNTGNILRDYYQLLSPDPNSLKNLDQDLPNFIQHIIPIYSLPQHWLWCETWCSDETMNSALTIDLCNNPYTKKSKLDVAFNRINEWYNLDREANFNHYINKTLSNSSLSENEL